MPGIGEALRAQHDRLDALLAQTAGAAHAGDWTKYRSRLASLRAALAEHMAYEEEELFPALSRAGSAAGELAALLEQHAQLRRLLDILGAAAPQHDPEGCIAELESLAATLAEHHASELAACYPRSDAVSAPLPPELCDAPSGLPAAATRELDLRGLQPPEPIMRIFEALESAPQQPLRAILPHEPAPLYGLLRERGYSCTGTPRADGGFEVLIKAPPRPLRRVT